jgi:hypothetical protein
MNRTALNAHVRSLTGTYSTDVVTDDLINTWLNESYAEVARDRDWDWLESTYSVSVPAAVDGIHTVTLPSGSKRVLSAYLVDDSGQTEEMVNYPELDSVRPTDAGVFYDVNFSGQFRFTPEQSTDKAVKIRYTQVNPEMSSGTDSPVFADQFHVMLAYRAAVNVLMFISDDTNRSEFYLAQYQSLLLGMYDLYELDHDYRTFQLGQKGSETRKYYPWFRPV